MTLGRHCTTRWRVQPVGFVQSHIALGDRGGKEPKTRHHMETRCFCRETDPGLDVAVVNLQLEPFFFLVKWNFSRHPMCKGSNFRDHWMQSPCWRKKWSTSSEDPQGTADESRRFARTWDVQKIPRVWQPFRKSASPG